TVLRSVREPAPAASRAGGAPSAGTSCKRGQCYWAASEDCSGGRRVARWGRGWGVWRHGDVWSARDGDGGLTPPLLSAWVPAGADDGRQGSPRSSALRDLDALQWLPTVP